MMRIAGIIVSVLIFVVVAVMAAFLAGIIYEHERREKEKLDRIINCLRNAKSKLEDDNDGNKNKGTI